jgi:excisionase family DNA binding protein
MASMLTVRLDGAQAVATRPATNRRGSMSGALLSPSSSQASSPWMTADETARVLDTTAHTLRRLAREDRSPVLARRIGGRWRFARRDVERYVTGDLPGAE